MGSFEDVERFVREHRNCGTLTPSTSAPIGGRHLLSLTCSCGKHFDRWVSAGDAEPPPVTPAPAPAPSVDPPAIDITPMVDSDERLEDVMRQALESLDTPKPPPAQPAVQPAPSPVAAPPPPPAPVTPPRAPSKPPAPPAAPAVSQAPPGRPDPPGTPAAPLPVPRRTAAPRQRAESAPSPDRGSLEEALRATLEALNAEGPATLTPTPRPAGGARGAGGDRTSAEAAPSSAGGRRPPDKHALQDALQATLSALEAERKTAPRGGRPGAGPAYTRPEPRRRRRLSIVGAIGISLALAAAVGVGYGLRAIGQIQPDVEPPAPRTAPRIRVAGNERAAVSQTVAVLRELQSISRPDVRYRFYFDRVAFAKGDVERHLMNVKDADLRRAIDETIALHVLAANAWRAKTLNERDKWEAVGDDPTSELCPQAKRVLAVSDEPANMSRAQWRGHALAAAVPLLWDCAGERLAAVERGLNQR